MEFKGTKGKWIYNQKLQMLSGYRTVYSEKNVRIHISENKNGLSEIEIEANALLISKAPEILEMLQKCVDQLPSGNIQQKNFTNDVKQLIKEATEI